MVRDEKAEEITRKTSTDLTHNIPAPDSSRCRAYGDEIIQESMGPIFKRL